MEKKDISEFVDGSLKMDQKERKDRRGGGEIIAGEP